MMDDEDFELGRDPRKMRDKEQEEARAQVGMVPPICMYRQGESRNFRDLASVPTDQGWVDSPAKVARGPEIKSVASASGVPALPEPPASGESPKRLGRKLRA